MKELRNMTIATTPDSAVDHGAAHLKLGMLVAITEEGLAEHNGHNMFNTIALGAGVGVVALPALIGGGIGIAIGGEAVGLGMLELGIIGGGAGSTIGKVVNKPITGHMIDGKHETLTLVDMVGVVQGKSRRWWDQPGFDVKVTWQARNAEGRRVVFTEYHNPEHLFGLKDA